VDVLCYTNEKNTKIFNKSNAHSVDATLLTAGKSSWSVSLNV